MRKRSVTAVAMSAVLAFGVGACGGPSDDDNKTDGNGSAPAFNAAIDKVFNASDKQGGTLKLAISERLGLRRPRRHLLRPVLELLAHLRPHAHDVQAGSRQGQRRAGRRPGRGPRHAERRRQDLDLQAATGLKFEDGTPITSKDVKYAVLRSAGQDGAPERPDLLRRLPRPAGRLQGRPTSPRASNADSAITTPDDQTIVFHLKQAVRRLRLLRPAAAAPRRCRRRRTPARSTRSTSSRPARTCSRPIRAGQELRPRPQPELGQGDRPEPPGAAGRATRSRSASTPTTSTTGSSPVTSTSTWPAPACSRRRSAAGPQRPEPEGARGQPGRWPAPGYTGDQPKVAPFDNIDCRKADRVRRRQAPAAGRRTAARSPVATSRPR